MEAIFTAWVDILLISQTAAMRGRTKGWDAMFQWGAPFRDVEKRSCERILEHISGIKTRRGHGIRMFLMIEKIRIEKLPQSYTILGLCVSLY